MAFEIRRYSDIMQQFTANMIAKQDKITDFNEGSVAHTIGDAVARVLERAYTAIRQGYNQLLRLVSFSIFGFQRKAGIYAQGTVIFGRAEVRTVRTTILAGTKISGGDNSYITTETGYIDAGALYSNNIPIRAEEAGTKYNIASDIIDTIDSMLSSDVVSVSNPNPITGGTDEESDNEVDERFKIYINGLQGTNEYAIRSAALTINAVRSVSVKEHKPPLRDVYNLSLYVDDGSGSASPDTIEAVELAVRGDGSQENQGHLAPGVNIRVLAPQTVIVNFQIVVYIVSADIQDTIEEARRAVSEYVNGKTIGQTVYLSEIISKLMGISYISDARIYAPSENLYVSAEQIARAGTITVEVIDSNG